MKESLEAFVNVLEKKFSPDGDIDEEYLDYLTEKFQKNQITLCLHNVGVKKLNKKEYNAAKRVFEIAISYDKDNPYLNLFYGIAICKSSKTWTIINAKKKFEKAKRLIKKEESSKYPDKFSSILDTYLEYFKYPIFGLCMPKNNESMINYNTSENYDGSKFDQRNSNNQVLNTAQSGSNPTFNQYNYTPEQKKTLAEAASEIQKLLKQLEETNPTATEPEKVAYVNDETTPSFKRRVVGAFQAGGETAIDEFILENKYLKVTKAAIKGWLQPGS